MVLASAIGMWFVSSVGFLFLYSKNVKCGSCCAIFMVFLMRWYVVKCLSHSLASLHGRNPPCCYFLFVRLGSGVAV